MRATTVHNIKNGLGAVRPNRTSVIGRTHKRVTSVSGERPGIVKPVGTPGSVSPFGNGWGEGTGDDHPTDADQDTDQPSGHDEREEWEIQAVVEMMSSAPIFVDEYLASIPGFALTLADRLHWAVGVPLSRFAFYIPDPKIVATTHFCYCNSNEEETNAAIARFAAASNSSFKCTTTPNPHKLNRTVLGEGAFLQSERIVRWEVGIYPPSHYVGDEMDGEEVGDEIVHFSQTSGEQDERILLKNGTWTYKQSRGLKFLGFFPATLAAWPGEPFPKARETSVALGPNPGGKGAMLPTTVPPGLAEQQKKLEIDVQADESLQYVDSVLHQANELNTGVENSVQELSDSLVRASRAHAAVMNIGAYTLPPDLD